MPNGQKRGNLIGLWSQWIDDLPHNYHYHKQNYNQRRPPTQIHIGDTNLLKVFRIENAMNAPRAPKCGRKNQGIAERQTDRQTEPTRSSYRVMNGSEDLAREMTKIPYEIVAIWVVVQANRVPGKARAKTDTAAKPPPAHVTNPI